MATCDLPVQVYDIDGDGNDLGSGGNDINGDGKNSILLVFIVSDTGQGMTKEQVDKLFDEYSRFNTEANRSTEGAGLGMSITRNLVRLMNGEISVDSKAGKGSTFTIRLSQTKAGPDVLGKEMVDNLRHFRIRSRTQMNRVQITREPMPYGNVLIVDDVETNIYVAKGLLSPYGLKIDSAESGFEAIRKVRNGRKYDIIFMDHMMPQMDGIEAAKIIRAMGYIYPIVALTANAVSGQAEMFLANGFDDFISKPIDVRQLNVVLNKLIRDKQPPGIVAAEQQQSEITEKQGSAISGAESAGVNPLFAEIFARDANKSLAVLCRLMEKGDFCESKKDAQVYTVHVHGMKGALANIGKTELSEKARKLETSVRDGDWESVLSETPAFLNSLRGLVEELTPDADPSDVEKRNEDFPC
jgi:CheY-like chemotaxis protein